MSDCFVPVTEGDKVNCGNCTKWTGKRCSEEDKLRAKGKISNNPHGV